MKTTAWIVTRPGRARMHPPHAHRPFREDIVFVDADQDAETVRRSLVNHDGYEPDIIVRKRAVRS